MLSNRTAIRFFFAAFLFGFSLFAAAKPDLSISRELEFRGRDSRKIFDLISTPSGTVAELLKVPGVESYLAGKFKTSDSNFLAQIKFDSLSIDLKFAISNLIIQSQIHESQRMISYERPLNLYPLVLKSVLPIVLQPGESFYFQGINYSNELGQRPTMVDIDLTRLFRPTVERLHHEKNLESNAFELHVTGLTVSDLIEATWLFFKEVLPRRIDGDPTDVEPVSDHFHFVADYNVFFETNVARQRALHASNQSSTSSEAKLFALAATLWIIDLELARTYSDFADNGAPSTISGFVDDSAGRLAWLDSTEDSRRLVFDWMDPTDIPLVFKFFQDFASPSEFAKKMDPETRVNLKTNLNGPRKGIFRDKNLFSVEARLFGYTNAQLQENSKTRMYLESLHSVMHSNRIPDQYLRRAFDIWKIASAFTSPAETLTKIWMKSDLASLKSYFGNTSLRSAYHGNSAKKFRLLANHLISSEEFKYREKTYKTALGTEKFARYPEAFFILVPWADFPLLMENEELRQRVFDTQLRALSESIDDDGSIMEYKARLYGGVLQNLMGELTFIELSKGKIEPSDIQAVFNKEPLLQLAQAKVDTSSVGLEGKLKSLLLSCGQLF